MEIQITWTEIENNRKLKDTITQPFVLHSMFAYIQCTRNAVKYEIENNCNIFFNQFTKIYYTFNERYSVDEPIFDRSDVNFCLTWIMNWFDIFLYAQKLKEKDVSVFRVKCKNRTNDSNESVMLQIEKLYKRKT